MLWKCEIVNPILFKIADLAGIWGVVSIRSLVDGESHSPSDVGRRYLPDLSTRSDAYRQPAHEY